VKARDTWNSISVQSTNRDLLTADEFSIRSNPVLQRRQLRHARTEELKIFCIKNTWASLRSQKFLSLFLSFCLKGFSFENIQETRIVGIKTITRSNCALNLQRNKFHGRVCNKNFHETSESVTFRRSCDEKMMDNLSIIKCNRISSRHWSTREYYTRTNDALMKAQWKSNTCNIYRANPRLMKRVTSSSELCYHHE